MGVGRGYSETRLRSGTQDQLDAWHEGEGANGFAEAPIVRHKMGTVSLLLSPAVHKLAESGAWWLMDLVLSYGPGKMLNRFGGRAFLTIEVRDDGSALVTIHDGDDGRRGTPVTQNIMWTDFPKGKRTLNIMWLYPDGTLDSREPIIMFPGEE